MLTCSQCSHANPRKSKFCEACGTSLARVAASERAADEIEADGMLLEVKKAQGAMLVVAVVQMIAVLFLTMTAALDGVTTVVMLLIAGVFFGLWVWAKHNPLAAAIVGLVVFLSLHLADAIVDPTALLRGIVLKIIVIAILGRAIAAGIKHREFVRERGLS
jgi:hypothetical protein